MSERLDRIEAVLDKLAEQKEADQQAMAEFRAAVASLAQVRESDQQEIIDLRSAVTSLVQIAEIHQQNYDRIWDEIRGLRTESQRILEYLFGQQENGQQ